MRASALMMLLPVYATQCYIGQLQRAHAIMMRCQLCHAAVTLMLAAPLLLSFFDILPRYARAALRRFAPARHMPMLAAAEDSTERHEIDIRDQLLRHLMPPSIITAA